MSICASNHGHAPMSMVHLEVLHLQDTGQVYNHSAEPSL